MIPPKKHIAALVFAYMGPPKVLPPPNSSSVGPPFAENTNRLAKKKRRLNEAMCVLQIKSGTAQADFGCKKRARGEMISWGRKQKKY